MMGTRIAALRRNLGMSQAQLAACLQVSPSAVGMYEQGRREPAAQTLAAMARLFGVTVDFLITGENPSVPEQTLESRIAAADRRLENRSPRPFSRQELAVLLAAMLMESEDSRP